MKAQKAFRYIQIVSIAGILFSGYLSFSEVLMGACPVGGCGNLLGVPVCVYGLAMYIIVFILSYLGLKK